MRRTEMLWFEDVSPINEPVLSFPVFGRISMKQFFILGIAGMISYGLFTATHGPVSAVPMSIGAFLTLVKPKVGSTEWMFLSITLFLFGRLVRQRSLLEIIKTRGRKRARASKKLCLPGRFTAVPQENKMKVITLADLSKPFRFKMRISSPTGHPIAYKKSKIYLDDVKISSLVTDVNGWLEVSIVPKTVGQKQITVYVEDQSELAFCSIIEIRASQENLP